MTQVSAPNPGAILFARMPDAGYAARSKLRPVIVIATTERNGLTYLIVVKGTSQHSDEVYRGEFVVRSEADLKVCGLSKPTKFQFSRVEEIPYTKDWCCMRAAGHVPITVLRAMFDAAREAKLV